MFAVGEVIKNDLGSAPAFAGYAVRLWSDDSTSKRKVPALEVAFEGVRVADANDTSAKLAVAWGVHIILPRSDTAAVELDGAFASVVGLMHGFCPGKVGGRAWSNLKLMPGGTAVQAPELAEQGLVEYAVVFETFAVYGGRK
jgi:hypothetical protein